MGLGGADTSTTAESIDIPAYALKSLLNHKMNNDVTGGPGWTTQKLSSSVGPLYALKIKAEAGGQSAHVKIAKWTVGSSQKVCIE